MQHKINPRGPPANTVFMRDERRGHVLINKPGAIDEEVCITPGVYCPLSSGFTSYPGGVEIAGEKNASTYCDARSSNPRYGELLSVRDWV